MRPRGGDPGRRPRARTGTGEVYRDGGEWLTDVLGEFSADDLSLGTVMVPVNLREFTREVAERFDLVTRSTPLA
jgi:hypothetical protein